MMRKVVTPDAWKHDDAILAPVPMCQNGRMGPADFKTFVKRAGTELAQKVAGANFQPGDVPIHLIALSATEASGPNRNGDGFREAVLKEYHPTFVKNAKFYRNHKSDDPNNSFGIVKLSWYNPAMRRVELIVGLNGDERAARRNGGKVADIELQKLAAEQEIPVSMGTRVSHDICSFCGNKAATRRHYCTESMCKAGGLQKYIGQVVELDNGDAHHLHADNPDPIFHDISHVSRPADRTAYVLRQFNKSAAAVISGAELAEYIFGDDASPVKKEAAYISAVDAKLAFPWARALVQREPVPVIAMPTVEKLAQFTRALSEHNIVLPIDAFVSVLSGGRPVSDSLLLKQAAYDVFSRIVAPATNPYFCNKPVPTAYAQYAAKIAGSYSLSTLALRERLMRATVNDIKALPVPYTKTASFDGLTEELAQQYGLYVLASLKHCQKNANSGLTAITSILQNRVY
jgi:hypothetical protein